MVVTEVAMDNYGMRGGWQGQDAENELRRRAAPYMSAEQLKRMRELIDSLR